ncbi:hypothetical protein CRG98_022055 [Punica granatum]|uniref:Uncharacterized protein n=1 Tax=Punica granatum TaxID=22663 RepID=A0A2I0JMS3_PUNGR|nr:hypothetical protein CRG98_022055 [Punica granatum]
MDRPGRGSRDRCCRLRPEPAASSAHGTSPDTPKLIRTTPSARTFVFVLDSETLSSPDPDAPLSFRLGCVLPELNSHAPGPPFSLCVSGLTNRVDFFFSGRTGNACERPKQTHGGPARAQEPSPLAAVQSGPTAAAVQLDSAGVQSGLVHPLIGPTSSGPVRPIRPIVAQLLPLRPNSLQRPNSLRGPAPRVRPSSLRPAQHPSFRPSSPTKLLSS